jgi:hypothetical protein
MVAYYLEQLSEQGASAQLRSRTQGLCPTEYCDVQTTSRHQPLRSNDLPVFRQYRMINCNRKMAAKANKRKIIRAAIDPNPKTINEITLARQLGNIGRDPSSASSSVSSLAPARQFIKTRCAAPPRGPNFRSDVQNKLKPPKATSTNNDNAKDKNRPSPTATA